MLLVGRVKNPEPRTSDFSTDPDFSTDLLLTTAVLKSGSDCTSFYVPSIWNKLPRTTQKLMLRVKKSNPSLHNQIKTLAHLKAIHTSFSWKILYILYIFGFYFIYFLLIGFFNFNLAHNFWSQEKFEFTLFSRHWKVIKTKTKIATYKWGNSII